MTSEPISDARNQGIFGIRKETPKPDAGKQENLLVAAESSSTIPMEKVEISSDHRKSHSDKKAESPSAREIKETSDKAQSTSSVPPPRNISVIDGEHQLPAFKDKPGWKDEIIYFVVTDRFHNSDKSNDFNIAPHDLKKFHGGDLQGIIDKLDYIKNLGVSAIWITPVMDNQNHFIDNDGYHGYWPIDFYRVEEHLGDMDKMKELVEKAHQKGLKVILDLPLNQIAWEHPWTKDPSKKDWLHHYGDIKDWNDPWWLEHGSLWGMPDLAHENPEVSRYLIEMAKWWIKETQVDGFRLDAVKHVPRNFWKQFSQEIREFAGKEFLLLGEDFDGRADHVASYQKDGMTGLLDFPLYFATRDAFAYGGNMRNLAATMEYLNKHYDNPANMGAMVDNHDVTRFLTLAEGNKSKLKLALAFLFTINRIPVIYYGDEVGMEGRGDISSPPENRKDMEWNKDPELLAYFKKLTSLRKSSDALEEGNFLEMWQDEHIYGYQRQSPDGKSEAIVILNNSRGEQTREIPLRAESKIPDGTVLKDALSGSTITVSNRKIKVTLGGEEPKIFIWNG